MTDGAAPRAAPQPVRLAVEYDGADDLLGDFAASLSSGGTVVATAQELAPETRVQLVLSFPGLISPIALEGTVRAANIEGPDGQVAARIELDAAGCARLATVIARIRDRDPMTVAQLLRVLIVEDNRHVATLIQDGLRAAARREVGGAVAFVFHNAEDGHRALELLQRERFDVLIVDVYLPIMDGTRVIAHVRRQLDLTELPIIAVSAGGEAARRAALDAGANVFLDKPMRLRQVSDAIRSLLPNGGRGEGSNLVAASES